MEKLTLDEFINLTELINGTEADCQIAISNIENLNLKKVYIYLIYKATKNKDRITSINKNDITFKNIYDIIILDEHDAIPIFLHVFSDFQNKISRLDFLK